MKSHLPLLIVLSALFAFLIASQASAQVVYENGPINGNTDAWTINFGYALADTFTISTASSTITGLSFGAWLFPGDVLESAEVSITEYALGGTTYFDGTVNLTQSNCSLNSLNYDVCTETGSFHGPTMPNGTYWLDLQNAVVNNGDPVYWDENSGEGCHSQGCPSVGSEGGPGTVPSESFSILGTTSGGGGSTPEPGSLLLFAGGLISCLGFIRRGFRA